MYTYHKARPPEPHPGLIECTRALAVRISAVPGRSMFRVVEACLWVSALPSTAVIELDPAMTVRSPRITESRLLSWVSSCGSMATPARMHSIDG